MQSLNLGLCPIKQRLTISFKKVIIFISLNYKKIIMNKVGSSETIRRTTFNFYTYKKNLVSHKKKINVKFLQWFIGFTEGNGSFIVSTNCLFFIINKKEEKILHFIRTNLGFGKVSKFQNYSRFIVSDKSNIDKLIFIFNGHLVLNKTNACFVCWLNARNNYSLKKLYYLNKNEFLSLHDNAWLSGFIDADGCFSVNKIKDSRYILGYRLRLRFILNKENEINIFNKVKMFLTSGVITKRKTHFPFLSFYNFICKKYLKNETYLKNDLITNKTCNLIKTKSVHLKYDLKENLKKYVIAKSKQKEDSMLRFTTTSLLSNELIINYLKSYPLRTFKKVSFLRFTCLFRYIKNRKKIPWEGKVLKKVEKLIKNI